MKTFDKIVMFGCGQAAEWIYAQLPDAERRVLNVVDFFTPETRKIKSFHGFCIEHYSTEKRIFDEDVMLLFGIGSWNVGDYAREIVAYVGGNVEERLFLPNTYVSLRTFCRPNRFWDEPRVPFSDPRYTEVAGYFDDAESMEIFRRLTSGKTWDSPSDEYEIINYKKIRDMLICEDNYWCTYDFSNETHGDTATVIDGGAYTGDSILPIVSHIPERQIHYLAFEPDEESCEMISEAWKNSHAAGELTIFPNGLGEKNKRMYFRNEADAVTANGGYCLSEDECADTTDADTIAIEVKAIDELNIIPEGQLYIKMDIEGSELDALKGAERTIRTYKPYLAICVYHRKNDLVEIPMYLKQLVPEYQFYLRGGYHSILWAIPRKQTVVCERNI